MKSKDYTIKESLDYNSNTGVFTWKVYKGPQAHPKDVAGSITNYGQVMININGEKILAHRLAWYFVHGVWPEHNIFHINGNKTDNRIENLREVDPTTAALERPKAKNNTSGYKGVTYNKANDRWVAQIVHRGSHLYLGSFKSKTEAHVAYQMEAAKLKAESN